MKKAMAIVGVMLFLATVSRATWEFHGCYDQTLVTSCTGPGSCTKTVIPRHDCAIGVGGCSSAGSAITITTYQGTCNATLGGLFYTCGSYGAGTGSSGTSNC
jgi:hypothetical protein